MYVSGCVKNNLNIIVSSEDFGVSMNSGLREALHSRYG